MAYPCRGISQARILKWVAIPFSWGSFQPRDWTWLSCTAGRFFIVWATREAPKKHRCCKIKEWTLATVNTGTLQKCTHIMVITYSYPLDMEPCPSLFLLAPLQNFSDWNIELYLTPRGGLTYTPRTHSPSNKQTKAQILRILYFYI